MREDLAKVVNDKSRRITIRGKQAIVPLKFDEDGNPATVDKLIFKRLSLTDLRFLGSLRKNEWDTEKAACEVGIPKEKAERLIKKLACFREEDAKVKALAEIPTPSWIKAKHVENIYNPTLADSQQKSLSELAKIEGAYKTSPLVNIQNNFFAKPSMTPEQEEATRKFFDTIAVDGEQHVA